jgi:hypothetical protein
MFDDDGGGGELEKLFLDNQLLELQMDMMVVVFTCFYE